MEKVDVVVTRECPLILGSTASPNCFGTMEIEKGAYVEIRANMDISIDVLKRAEDGVQTDRVPPQVPMRQSPRYDFLSLIHISEHTRQEVSSSMPSSA